MRQTKKGEIKMATLNVSKKLMEAMKTGKWAKVEAGHIYSTDSIGTYLLKQEIDLPMEDGYYQFIGKFPKGKMSVDFYPFQEVENTDITDNSRYKFSNMEIQYFKLDNEKIPYDSVIKDIVSSLNIKTVLTLNVKKLKELVSKFDTAESLEFHIDGDNKPIVVASTGYDNSVMIAMPMSNNKEVKPVKNMLT
jgi:hypothetical protein